MAIAGLVIGYLCLAGIAGFIHLVGRFLRPA